MVHFCEHSSPYTRIAAPLHIGHFARHDINLERAAGTREAILSQSDNIMAWLEQDSESAVFIRRERSDRLILSAYGKSCAWKRRRIGKVGSGPDRSRANWPDRDDTLNPASCCPTYLTDSQACGYKKEQDDDSYHPRRNHDPSTLPNSHYRQSVFVTGGFQIGLQSEYYNVNAFSVMRWWVAALFCRFCLVLVGGWAASSSKSM
jgi:hypothetical protein